MPELPAQPKQGENLRTIWAQRLLTMLRSMRLRAGPGIVLSADAEGTSVALAPELRQRAKPRPFAVRLALDNDSNAATGAIAVYCCLPPETAEAVRYGAQALAPGASVQLGSAENPWVRLEAASDQTPPLWLCVVAPDEQSGGASGSGSSGSGSSGSSGSGSSGSGSQGEAGTWELQFSATPPTQSKSGGYACKAHLVAECTLSGGVVQYHLGSLLLDGSGDDWKADSDAKQYFSIDPPSVALKYETETVDETVTQTYGKGIDGQPLTRQVTVKKTRVKTDANGQPIPKQRQARDANGLPVVDGQGNPVMEPDTTPAIYHQIHNFDSGSDNELLETANEDGYGGTPVACRVTNAQGIAEIMWRRIPGVRRGEPGEPGEPGADGCSPQVDVSIGSAGAGTVAGTIAITPCKPFTHEDPQTGKEVEEVDEIGNPAPRTITVYNGKDGVDGCSPQVDVQPGNPSDAGHGGLAGTITVTPCKPFVDGQGNPEVDGQGNPRPRSFSVYHGKDAAGTFSVVTGMRLNYGALQYELTAYQFVNGVLTTVASVWNDLGVNFEDCPAGDNQSGSGA